MPTARRAPLAACLTVPCALVASMVLAPQIAGAERLAAKRFTTADGLAGDFIISVSRDSRGFLWFSTRDGLSRFDGAEFVTYGLADGLPHATVNDVLETRDGVYWVATNGGGVARMHPRGLARTAGPRAVEGADAKREPLFEQFLLDQDPTSNRVNVLFEDRRGRVWAGSDNGLFRLEAGDGRLAFQRVSLPRMAGDASFHGVGRIVEDAEGSVWVTGGFGLMRLLPDGRGVVYELDAARSYASVVAIAFDPAGRMWFGTLGGLLILDAEPVAAFPGDDPLVRRIRRVPGRTAGDRPAAPLGAIERRALWFTREDGLAGEYVTDILVSSRGDTIWIGGERGLTRYENGLFRGYSAINGVPGEQVTSLVEDAAGNLWIATVAGAARLVPHGLVTFDRVDGLDTRGVRSLYLDAAGRLFAITGDYTINAFDGARFGIVRPRIPADSTCTWMSRCLYLDRRDRWWMVGALGLFQWPGVDRAEDLAATPPGVRYGGRDGLADDNTYSVYEDQRGRVWVGTSPGGIAMREPGAASFRAFSEADGLPSARRIVTRANAFAEDRSGAVWIGFGEGSVARWRGDRFEPFGRDDGIPEGSITALLVDAAGRLWIATNQGGLGRMDDPTAPRPAVIQMTEADGLASQNVRCLAEDRYGRVYAGTSRGVDRIELSTGAIRHFGVSEGLASDFVTSAIRDAQGHLWFGTVAGLSRLDPEPAAAAEHLGETREAVPVFISAVRAGGVPQAVSTLGETAPAPLTLSAGRNQLEIGYFGLSFAPGAALRYQYRLAGGNGDWSPPTPVRAVNYASLAPGRYRFEVRAVRPDGAASTAPAALEFDVLPPFYARWWFVVLAIGAVGGVAFMFYRARLTRLVGLERVRARIATDLHDDIGSSLSQIAILAEVARSRLPAPSADDPGSSPVAPLDRIAETSRALVDSMSDIVWAISPRVDTLSDLVHRMRRFVEDTLGATDIDVAFRVPPPGHDVQLGADVRREVFLILKESATNIAKHARATRVEIDLAVARRGLRLRVADNGVGFDPAAATDGNGVASMRRRVEALGGTLTIDTAPGRGTVIELTVDRTGAIYRENTT